MLKEPQLPPIPSQDRGTQLLENINNPDIPMSETLEQVYLLTAKRIDLSGENTNSLEALDEALQSPAVAAAYEVGFEGGTVAGGHKIIYAPIIKVVNETFNAGNVVHLPILRSITETKSSWPVIKQVNKLRNDVAEHFSNSEQGVIYLDVMAARAIQEIRQIAEHILNPDVKVMPGFESVFFSTKLKQTKLLEGYVTRVRPLIRQKAEELFGGNAELVLQITRNLILLDPQTLLNKRQRVIIETKSPVFEAIARRDIESALSQFRELVLTHSAAFLPEAIAIAGISEEEISQYRAELTGKETVEKEHQKRRNNRRISRFGWK